MLPGPLTNLEILSRCNLVNVQERARDSNAVPATLVVLCSGRLWVVRDFKSVELKVDISGLRVRA